jgi:predicted YcjX-like family ATPase
MNKETVAAFFKTIFPKKKVTAVVEDSKIHQELKQAQESFVDMRVSVSDISDSITYIKNAKLDMLKTFRESIDHINGIMALPEYPEMARQNPEFAQKLRDELTYIIAQVNKI